MDTYGVMAHVQPGGAWWFESPRCMGTLGGGIPTFWEVVVVTEGPTLIGGIGRVPVPAMLAEGLTIIGWMAIIVCAAHPAEVRRLWCRLLV